MKNFIKENNAQLARLGYLLLQQFMLQSEIDSRRNNNKKSKGLVEGLNQLASAAELVKQFEKNLEDQRELILPLIKEMRE